MIRWFDYLRRLIGTAIGFSLFGLGGLLLAVFLLPLAWLFGRGRQAREHIGRAVVQRTFRWFLLAMTVLGVAEFQFRGFTALQQRRGMLVVASHPTLIDVICLVARIDNADCVVKSALKRNPVTYGPITAAGYLTNAGGEELIKQCAASIGQGGNLIIFPEGTRSVPGKPMQLQRGAANIALQGNIDVTPVRITCDPPTLTKNTPWYRIPPRRFIMTLTVMEDIKLEDIVTPGMGRGLASRRLSEEIKRVLA